MSDFTAPQPTLQRGTFHLALWGCQMNVYDASRLRALMAREGYVERPTPEGVDAVLLVTCAVREKAEDKVFNQIAAWRHQGLIGPRTVIALGGCVGAELGAAATSLDRSVGVVFGPRSAHRVPALIEQFRATGRTVTDLGDGALEKFPCLPLHAPRAGSAFVTIMEGCSNHCSYCIVPSTRGEEESRPAQGILAECRALIEAGAVELNLLGQNANSYRGQGPDGRPLPLSGLLREVAALPGLQRLRFTTSNPMDFGDDLVAAIGDLEVVADAVHVPVQSGSDRILALMSRPYTHAQYLDLTRKLEAARPGILISSDFIVGFPGETEDDFQETLRLVDEVGFDLSFCFAYSVRPGTVAATLPGQVPHEVAMDRLYRLQERLEQGARAHGLAMVGTRARALVEGVSRKDSRELRGRTSHNRIAVFEGDPRLVGTMADIEITGVAAHTLKARIP
ncbi:MAG: tRNA (N6-isopentenyl adenosine(37)-C2)-methylthiotransferase MiaB [Succinivibrionaceae bacterium]|nr:tRNA (N6-isopentenyl adenosine(37)-C2)-methylthiotransferase MiaB [Succinivibrionaceae bacterium]